MTGLLLDEMLSPTIAEQLRSTGIDVYAITATPHLMMTPDPDVLELATAEDRVLVTINIRDFRPLELIWAGQGRSHGGVLYISSKRFPQDRTFVGAIIAALQNRVDSASLPGPGESDFI